MTDTPPRKPSFRTVVLIVLATAAVSSTIVYLARESIARFLEGEDTPIIVRDGSIVITSIGQALNSFSMPDPKVLIHPKTNAKLGKLRVDGQLKGSPCTNAEECGVEFVWSATTPGQPGAREYTVVVGSNSRDGKTAGIVSSVPFADYQASRAPDSTTGKTAYTYTWIPAGATLTFREARLYTTHFRRVSPRPTPQVLCSNPGCKIEFEYK
ncbi:MAG: hypothetical protein IH602_11865 [Bryobacteraceae bacterium]|nr:hypothetical protein [Bryobacteraceae bacterium]